MWAAVRFRNHNQRYRAVTVHYAMRGWMAEHSNTRMYNSWERILYRRAVTFTEGRSRPIPSPIHSRVGQDGASVRANRGVGHGLAIPSRVELHIHAGIRE